MNNGIYNSVLMNNVEMWNSIPCSNLLGLANAAMTNKGGGSGINMEFDDLNSNCGSCSVVDPYVRPHRYLIDLNSPPITVTEPSSQLTPVTPNETKSIEHKPSVSDIKQSNVTNSMQLEVNGDLKNGTSNEISLNKTPQPKEKRRKHRPKVVIEGQTKTAKRSTPKPDKSVTKKRKYVKKKETDEPKATDPTTVRETRNSCRRKVDFDQALSPITPNKTEVTCDKHPSSRAKRHLDFSNDKDYISIPGLHFPVIYKKKRSEKCQNAVTSGIVCSTWSAQRNSNWSFPAFGQKCYKNGLTFGQVENFRKKRTKGLKRVRDLASFVGMMEGKKWQSSYKRYTCMEALAADFGDSIATKKRTKRNSIVSSSFYHNHRFLMNHIGFQPGLRWKSVYDIEALINHFERLDINSQTVEKNRHALVPYVTRYQEKNALVLYKRDRSVVPFKGSYNEVRRRKPRPKVDLDDETSRVWRLLLENINNQGIDGTDEDKAKWWEEERNVFSGRAASFIARMHLVQGDRRFSQWKGSVVDSVIGVFLTQNVSDHLSSSAFMSLAAKYPLKSKSGNEHLEEEKREMGLDETIKRKESDADLDSSQNSVDTSPNSIQSSVTHHIETLGSCSLSNSIAELLDASKTTNLSGSTYDIYSMDQENEPFNKKIGQDNASEHSGISVESASQAAVLDIENLSVDISEVTETNTIVENSREIAQKMVESDLNENGNLETTVSGGSSKVKRGKRRKAKKIKADWDGLRVSAQVDRKRERTPNTMDSLDYEAVRCADANEIADTIKERGMNNMLADRIKDFLNRLVKDHGSIDLEWLRDVPPDKAKEYLLSFRGLGLKSVECVRLLTLHHLAFPVDTNVGRIAVRLGWVPLQPLPESLQLHLLELYPVLETIQKYLWPRLCKLDQRTLYELHYQMITFGKVFCTKSKPNCNACPMRGDCRHFASAFASARLALPAPEEKSMVSAIENKIPGQGQSPTGFTNHHHLTLPPASPRQQKQSDVLNRDPVIEEPATPEPIVEVPATPEPIVEVPATPEPEKMQQEFDIEDFSEDPEEIPTIKLNIEEFTQNLQTYMENNMELAEGDMSKALVALTSEVASIPTPKLKNVSQLRTEHQVYELPDSHPLLEGLDKRETDDPCSYLLAIWTPGETAKSIQPPEGWCSSQESGTLCHEETCSLCNSIREANSQTVRGTLLIPCRTAMRGSFPLNGTYFQVNEVFADHDSSLNPIDVPRSWLWNLPRRTVYFGTSIPTIFRGLTTEGIQYCFWRGFVCVRGFDQKTRAPRPLMARLHFPASKLKRSRGKTDEG